MGDSNVTILLRNIVFIRHHIKRMETKRFFFFTLYISKAYYTFLHIIVNAVQSRLWSRLKYLDTNWMEYRHLYRPSRPPWYMMTTLVISGVCTLSPPAGWRLCFRDKCLGNFWMDSCAFLVQESMGLFHLAPTSGQSYNISDTSDY